MVKIFISYRRADSLKDAGRIYDRLVAVFGADNIFKDMDSIPMGSDFRGVLREAVAQCNVLLAVIGQKWLTVQDVDGKRRLDNAGDFVRIEIESGLQRDSCLVIPVLVDGAGMPSAGDLPDVLRELAFKNKTDVRDDPDFHKDVDKLIRELQQRYGVAAQPVKPAEQPAAYDVHAAIRRFFEAFDENQWDMARTVLAEIRASGKAPRAFNVDAHEQDIWQALEAEERNKEYEVLRLMAKRPNPARVWEALQEFWQTYPSYDPDNLARFEPPPPTPIKRIVLPPRSQVPDMLADGLFAWVDIPAGPVTLTAGGYVPEGGQTFNVPAFAIAKYPVTNAQYAKFIQAGGYTQEKWWTPDAWQVREKEKWAEPRYWQQDPWKRADHPVVGVAWYEAVAFCAWLKDVSGENVMLPTEQQWQRAAQAKRDGGDSGWAYPWGEQWEVGRCNNSVSPEGSKATTPVTEYAGKGDSLCGVTDLSGNVWEWCLTQYNSGSDSTNGTEVRVLRGGSWVNFNTVIFRTDYRIRNFPLNWGNSFGFRFVRS